MGDKNNQTWSRRSVLRTTGATLAGSALVGTASGAEVGDGSKVRAIRLTIAHEQPGTRSKSVATVRSGTDGEVVNGPEDVDGTTWWGVRFDRSDGAVWGWVQAQNLAVRNPSDSNDGGDCSVTKTAATTGQLSSQFDTAVHSYQVGTDSPCTVEVSLEGPSTLRADFDLYVTTDGRTPSRTDHDYRSSTPMENEETVTIPGTDLASSRLVRALVNPYRGKGKYRISFEETGSNDSGGPPDEPENPDDPDEKPAVKYSTGLRVEATKTTGIHEDPKVSSPNATTVGKGDVGRITEGPKKTPNAVWWKVDFGSGKRGWTFQEYMGASPKFSSNERVATTDELVVHEKPGLSSPDVFTAESGATGYVRDGYELADGYLWWKVAYNSGDEGWAVQRFMERAPKEDDGGERQVRGTFRRPPTKLETMKADIDEYVSEGVSDLAINTFLHGETIFPSDHVTSKDYPEHFLEETIEYAHEQSIRVHGWMLNMYLWNPRYLGDVPEGHLLDGDDEVCAGGTCATLDRDLITETESGSTTAEGGKVFGSPFNDEIVGTLADVAAETDEKFDLDGIMVDYVRFPKSGEPFGFGESVGGESTHEERVDAVTDMVDEVVGAVSDETITSAAVFPSYYRSETDSEHNKAQDWKSWKSETPLDALVPMCYGLDKYDEQLAFADDARDDAHDVYPALAITDGHDDLTTQFNVWDEYGFSGYMVWKGESIDSELP